MPKRHHMEPRHSRHAQHLPIKPLSKLIGEPIEMTGTLALRKHGTTHTGAPHAVGLHGSCTQFSGRRVAKIGFYLMYRIGLLYLKVNPSIYQPLLCSHALIWTIRARQSPNTWADFGHFRLDRGKAPDPRRCTPACGNVLLTLKFILEFYEPGRCTAPPHLPRAGHFEVIGAAIK